MSSGTVTFVFTDIEGSTRMWETDPASTAAAVAEHERLLRARVAQNRGRVIKGTGDGILAVFDSANDALAAAVDIQIEMKDAGEIRARIGLNTGEAEVRDDDYYGIALNRCQRVMTAAHGGQILLTLATEEVLTRPLPRSVTLKDLGRHWLRDVSEAVHVFQAVHPQLQERFPQLRDAGSFAHNLPEDLTTFVGRSDELADVKALLGESRLVTLTGTGGAGKSRLALQIARRIQGDFPSGTWLVELAALSEHEMVAGSIALAVGVPEEPGIPLLQGVAARLGEAPALLILDNCEHLLGASAAAVDELLRAAGEIKILATSRERLGVPGETVFVVPPMSVPDEVEGGSSARALAHDSVRLFADRASRALPGFRVTDGNAASVSWICRAVDGIPLAIELAAGRVGSLSVSQIADRLGARLEILGGGSRTVDQRHQTMLSTLDWSYELLTPAERSLLAQLAVFRGSFDIAHVESVCEVESPEGLLDLVMALHDKSLLVRDTPVARFRLLEPVRRYAWNKLVESGRERDASLRHARYFADLAEATAAGGDGIDREARLDRLGLEHDNLRAALRASLDSGSGDIALRIAGATWDLWMVRGHRTEGREWLEEAIANAKEPDDSVLARALRGAAALATAQGAHARARSLAKQSLELAEQIGDEPSVAASLRLLDGLRYHEGELDDVRRSFEQALEAAREGDDPARLGRILVSLAVLSEDQGRVAEAERYVEEALEACRRADDQPLSAEARLAQGEISINRGRFDLAHDVIRETLESAQAAGLAESIAGATALLGKLALAEGRVEEADQRLSEALAIFQRLVHPVGTAWTLRHLGRAAMEEGDAERARALLMEALTITVEQVRPDGPLVLQAVAEMVAEWGDPEKAATLFGAAEGARERMGLVLAPQEQRAAHAARDRLVERLGRERFDEMAEHGRAMSLDEASKVARG
ncbi:MAG TPA: tetratricopeptide repeat protein [Acidimicrobiia bacterium]|nr:tetratricopeptide repeat protein [Acidimicrobiia bacterium]